ncbi:MAG: DMT family transporter [Planctomycetota bacterium]|jgi:drug/metabolite transporter (DMT)-like permease
MQIQKTKGTLYILISTVMFCMMTCLVKTAPDISPFKTTFMRFVIGLLIISIFALTTHIRLKFTNWRLLLLRGVLGSFGVLLTYLVIVKIGVSKSTMILYSYPVFASLFGAFFLKEHLRGMNFAALAAALAGLYLLVTPVNGFEGFLSIGIYELAALGAMMIYAMVVVTIRKLHETESTYEILFAQCAVGSAILLVPANTGDFSISWIGIVTLLGIGILATCGQLTMTQGYRYLPVKIASLLTMLQLVLNYVAGIVIFDETVTVRAFIGAAFIFAACLTALLAREKT